MRYLITGGSGYIGTRLVAHLAERAETAQVSIADVRPPRTFGPKVAFEEVDVRDRTRVRRLLERERPDVLVHLAFVLNPMHDEHAMYEIDVGGTQNVLEAASAAGTEHVLVTSSATAYGAFPDNPVPLTEGHPVRGVPDFEYARDKAESDRLCQLWACEHPDRVMTIVRPCIVFGPTVDNYISRTFKDQPFFADFGEGDVPVQFVHEDDVVDALVGLLDGRHAGAFNVSPDDWMTVGECAELVGLRLLRVRTARSPRRCGGCGGSRRRPATSASCATRGSPRTRSSSRRSTGPPDTPRARRSRSPCGRAARSPYSTARRARLPARPPRNRGRPARTR